jgi:hypothetical protein
LCRITPWLILDVGNCHYDAMLHAVGFLDVIVIELATTLPCNGGIVGLIDLDNHSEGKFYDNRYYSAVRVKTEPVSKPTVVDLNLIYIPLVGWNAIVIECASI